MFNSKVVSIDIGSRNIHIIEGRRRGSGIEVEKSAMIQTPSGSFIDGRIENPQLLRRAIRSALSQYKIWSRKVVLTIQSTAVITREIILPTVKQEEFDTMIRYEAERYLPIATGEHIIQYKVLGEVVEDNVKKWQIHVAAMPKDIAEGCFHFLKSMNLDPLVLDIHSNVISKLFSNELVINGEEYGLDQTVAVMDIGYRNTSINIISRGKTEFTRTVLFGGRDIDNEISRCLGITLDQAEMKKVEEFRLDEPAFLENLPEELNNSIRRSLDQWVSEVQKILTYGTSRSPFGKIHAIYLYGGSSGLNGISRYLEQHLGIRTVHIESISSASMVKKGDSLDGRNFINAIGGMIRC